MKFKIKYFLAVSLISLASCQLGSSNDSSSVTSSESSASEEVSSSVSSSSSSESSSSSVSSSSVSTVEVPEGYTLYWNDEFDLPSLNRDDWSYQTGNGSGGWGNQEIQYYQEENVELVDGKLIINVNKEKRGNFNYTSARIRTADKVSIKYGRIEACISLPEVEGLWPAFWMLPESDSPYGQVWAANGEIDIMEARGRVNDMTSAALHYGQQYQSTYTSKNYIFRESTISEYHVYALEWEVDEMRWYVDDDLFFTMSNSDNIPNNNWWSASAPDSTTAPFDWDFHILLNVAVGGHFDGFREPPEDFTNAQMKVDYVRMYKPIV